MFQHNTLNIIKNLKKQLYIFLAVLTSLDGYDADYGSVCYFTSFSRVSLQGLMIICCIVSEWAKVNTRGFFPAVFVQFLTAALHVCPPWTRYSVVLMQIAVPLHIWLPALLCITQDYATRTGDMKKRHYYISSTCCCTWSHWV